MRYNESVNGQAVEKYSYMQRLVRSISFFHKNNYIVFIRILIHRLLRYSQRTKEQKLFRCASTKYQMGIFSTTRLTVYKTKKTTKTTKKLQKPEKTTFSREK